MNKQRVFTDMDGGFTAAPNVSKLFDESKTLVFRDHETRSRITVPNYEVVDVRADTDVSAVDFSVTLLWDAIEEESHHYSSCKVTTEDVKVQAFCDSIRQKNYQMLHHLCGSLFRKYGVKLQHLRMNPLTLYMVHQNKNMCEAVLSDPRISELISVYVGPVLRLTWSESASPMIAEHQLDFKQVTDEGSRLKDLENHLQSLLNTIEARFEEQTAFNSRISLMIEKLQLWMSKMNTTTNMGTNETGNLDGETTETAYQEYGVFETGGLINQTVEGNSDLTRSDNSSRNIIGDGQPQLISKDVGQQLFHSNMSSTSESSSSEDENDDEVEVRDEDEHNTQGSSSSKDENDDEDEVKDEDADNSQDRTMIFPCKDEKYERTFDHGQSIHGHVPGPIVKLVTNGSRLQDEGKTVAEEANSPSDEFIQDTTVGQENEAHGYENDDKPNAFTEQDLQFPSFEWDRDTSLPSVKESSLVRAESFLQHHSIQGSQTLVETIAIALTDDAKMPSKTESLDTILCLDTSASLKEEGFAEMKKLALDFVEGIEEMTEKQDIEENIAVVAFGGGSRIVHFLSNDYGSVRDSIMHLEMGGGSPLFEALLVSLCAFKDRGGIMNIAGVHKLGPRLIVLSDCRPTHEQEKLATDQHGHSAPEVVMILMKLLPRFNKKRAEYPYPVTWIPVGKADKNMLSSFAKMSGGKVLEGEEIMQLCKYQWIQRTVGNIFAVIKEGAFPDTGNMTDDIKACIEALSGDLNPTDKAEVLETVTAKFDEKSHLDDDDDDFDNIRESDDQDLPCLGARVIRGPDWNWQNQDSGGPGTVVNHKKPGWLSVHWDNGHRNIYRHGFQGKYDVCEVKDMPRQITSDLLIEIGCEVTRGPDWIGGDEDGGPGGVGVVLRTNNSGEVMVRWKLTHVIMKCRYGKDDKIDLKVRDPGEALIDMTQKEHFQPVGLGESESEGEGEVEGRWVWQWQDEKGQWHLYPEDDLFKLDKEYTKNQKGSCVVARQGNSYRVIFSQNIERGVGSQTRNNVRRTKVTEEEYVVMKQISKIGLYR